MTPEKEILSKLEILYLPQLSNKMDTAKKLQIEFFNKAIDNLKNQQSKNNYRLFEILCLKLLDVFGIKYYVSTQLLNEGIFILNHFPLHKLTKIHLRELKFQNKKYGELMNYDPFPLIMAPAIKFMIDQKIEKEKSIIIASKFNFPFNKIMESCNIYSINRGQKGGYQEICEFLRFNSSIRTIFIYPEPGSSGKKSKRQPYELEAFRSGYFNLSKDLKLDIIPIIHGIDSSMNYFIDVLDKLEGNECSPENSRKIMQTKIYDYVS